MRTINSLILSVLFSIVSNAIFAQTLSISTYSIQVGAAQNSTNSFTISSDTYWGLYNIPQWIQVDTVWGNGTKTMNIKVDENSFSIPRSATIIIYCVDANWKYFSDKKITITQLASSKGISDTTVSVGSAMGNSASFSINSDTYWEVTEKPSWIFLNKTNHTSSASITVTVTKNPLIIDRIGYITIKRIGSTGNYIYGKVKVIQSQSSIGISKELLNFNYQDGNFEQVLINNNTEWSISGQANWVTVTPTTRTTNGFTKISVSKNTDIYYRVDTIQVACTDGVNYSIIIIQEPSPASIVINPSVLYFAKDQTSINVDVVANTNWGIINFPSWIDSDNIFGWGNKSFEFKAYDWVEQRQANVLLYWFDEKDIYHQQNLLIVQSSSPYVGVKDFNNSTSVFPNPVVDFLSLQTTNNNEIQSVKIYTIDGKLLVSCQPVTKNIDVSNFAEGVYILKCVNAQNQAISTQFIKKSR